MLEPSKHIISSFDAALYELKNDVLMMASLTDRMLQTALEGFVSRNTELCDQVMVDDDEIDTLEKQVDEEGVSVLLRFHPVASDMREVISAMKVSTSLERVPDQSVAISRRAKRLNSWPAVLEVSLLEPAYLVAVQMFRDSIRAFAEHDSTLAGGLKIRDEGIGRPDDSNWRKTRSPDRRGPEIRLQLFRSHHH
jgi:phosphate transport system protein